MLDFYTLRKDVEIASARVEEIRDSANLQQIESEIANLESKASDTSFWDDRVKAQETLSALNDLKDRLRLLSEFKSMVCSLVSSPIFTILWFTHSISSCFDVELRFLGDVG